MDSFGFKEARFDKYCKTCKNRETKETDDPCNECLNNPVNLYSHKPMKYEKDEKETQ